MREMEVMKPPVGAHVLVWGYRTIHGIIVRWLQYFWLGAKNAPTHIQRIYNGVWDISAEVKGVVLVDRLKVLKNVKRVKIVVHTLCTDPGMEKKFQKISDKYLKKPYDYYFYFNVALRVFIVFSPFIIIWTLMINGHFVLVLVLILIVLYWPIRRFLLNKSKNSWACAELSNCQDKEIGIGTGIHIHHNTSPLYYHRLSEACTDFKLFYDSGWIRKN